MNFSEVSKSLKKVSKILDKHLPAILTGIGAVGTVSGVVLSAHAGIKSSPILEERKKVHIKENMSKVDSAIDTVKCVGKYYIPTAVVTTASVACIISAHKVNTKRIAALATALVASQDKFKIYSDKVKEVVGEKKEQKIITETAAEQIEKRSAQNGYIPWDKLIEGEGPVIYHDVMTGKTWRSDPIKMTNYINEFNKNVANGLNDSCSIRDWYDMFEGVRLIPEVTDNIIVAPDSYHAGELPDLDRMTTTGPCIGGIAVCYLDYRPNVLIVKD